MRSQPKITLLLIMILFGLACGSSQQVTTGNEATVGVVESDEVAPDPGGQVDLDSEGNLTETNWEVTQAEGFTFSYPTNWDFLITPDYPPPGQSFRLVLPPELKQSANEGGTNIVIFLLPDAVDSVEALRAPAIAEIENNERFRAVGRLDVSADQVADRDAIRLRYSVTTTQDDQIEGLQVVTTLPNGQPLAVTLAVPDRDGVDFSVVSSIFEQIVESIEFAR